MKKIFIIFCLFFMSVNIIIAEPLKGEVSFDWISKSQMERDDNISEIRSKAFTDNMVHHYGKKFFKSAYKEKLKDRNYLSNYKEIINGKTEDSIANYCGFYWKKYLIAYGVQYKDKLDENLYYDAKGRLRWLDKYSKAYPDFPYITYQYNLNGDLKTVYYFLSSYDQYIFDENGKFKGRWYKDKMYDKNAKVIMTRTNWE